MRHLFMFVCGILTVALATACTDAKRASIGSIGAPADVTCYSGGSMIYSGRSTGRVASTDQSDGWEFKDEKTGKFMRVSGDCIVIN